MGLVTQLVIAAGLLAASYALRREPKDPTRKTHEPTTLSNRGEYLPLVFGTRRVGALLGWAGDREAKSVETGGKGGGGGASGRVYHEAGWHQLGVGPANKLHAIYANGEQIWKGPIDAGSTPSGTTVDAGEAGSFVIYWGETDQPINNFLAKPHRLGIASRWPGVCYVVWNKKTLGSSPTWPQLEYVIEFACQGTTLSNSAYELTDANGKTGLNPAHILTQVLAAKYPFGVGIPPDEIDGTSLEAFGSLCETEAVPFNMLARGGGTAEEPAQAILQDMGVVMPQAGDRLAFVDNRPPTGTLPSLNDDVVMPPDLERTIHRGDSDTTRPVFTFKDATEDRYEDQDIAFDDDGEASSINRIASQRVQIETVTTVDAAAKVARRRSQEATADNAVKVNALRGARQLVAGQAFERGGQRLRVLSKKWDDETPEVLLECALDTYAVPDIADPAPVGIGAGAALAPEADDAFTFLELPSDLTDRIEIVVLRIRAHSQIATAAVWASVDNTTYTEIGEQRAPAYGGLLETSLSASTNDTVSSGPRFEADSADAADALDLSSDAASWQAGRQVAVINNEVFFVQSLAVQSESTWSASTSYNVGDYVIPTSSTGFRYRCVSAGTTGSSEPDWPTAHGDQVSDGGVTWEARHFAYTMNGLIRARYSSSKASHSAGDRVFLADRLDLTPLHNPLMQAGKDLYVKTQPQTASRVFDIASVSPVSKTLKGLAVGEPDYEEIYDAGTGSVTGYVETNTGERIEVT